MRSLISGLCVILLFILFSMTVTVVQADADTPGVAQAVEYLLSCQNPDGGFANTPGGESNYAPTAQAAISLAQTGDLDRATKGDMLAYLSAHSPTDTSNYAGSLGRHIMGIVAAGGDPHDLDGTDYVQMLKDAEPSGQLFADSLIIMGLTAAGESDSQEVQDLIALYLQKQGTDGGWSWSPGGSDVDTTGMVVSALISAGVDPGSEPIQRASDYLRGIQDDSTGGFSMGNAMSSSPNTNSCGLAIMAINAVGQNASDWVTSSGKNPIDFMLTCQQDNGVIWWMPDSEGGMLFECTAYGALAMDGGFMPTIIL
jgi:prenyltransferase beta subunit